MALSSVARRLFQAWLCCLGEQGSAALGEQGSRWRHSTQHVDASAWAVDAPTWAVDASTRAEVECA